MVKQGYLRTVEAIIALVIILGVVFVALPRKEPGVIKVPYAVGDVQDMIKTQIMSDNSLKECIAKNEPSTGDCDSSTPPIDSPLDKVGGVISGIIDANVAFKNSYEHAYTICDKPTCLCDGICKKYLDLRGPSDINSNVFMSDVFVGGAVTGGKNKIVRFWIWKK
ncbi:hypothetical protein J4231_02865 [Candidatus Woesearchaeota archaeon]|nr:hypothetical protein [Candidatus Woesearchaeota archaeon]